ncbi:MAG: DNA polymerase III subunit alpha, partial [Oscillospiraceae bacterium]
KPENIEDLTAVISLYRPGPMDSIPKYIKNKHNPKQIKYKHPLLKPILDVTYGCIVYQEQVMQICRQLAGYSYGRADLVRRAMAKKKADVMEKEREIFMYGNDEVCGALKNGVSKEIADSIFDEMISFASYAFNKSHAAAYATVAYQTAYLKCHYKTEFMASLLTSVLGNTDKIIEYVEYCKATGITVLPPDINLSNSGFIVENNNIRFGILAIKNVGKSSIEGIIKERQLNGKYTDIINFIKRTNSFDLNKRAIESLIKCGAFDSFSNNRRELICSYEGIVDSVYNNERKNIEGQIDFFFNNNQKNEEYIIKEMEDFSPLQKLSMEKEITGIYISGHPLDNYFFSNATNILDVLNLEDFEDDSDVTILCIVQSIKTLVTKSKNVMAFLKAEDKTGVIEVIVFAKDYEPNRKIFEEGSIILINGKVSVKEDEHPKIILKKYETPSVNTIKNTLYIRFKSSQELNVNKVLSEISNNNQGNNV